MYGPLVHFGGTLAASPERPTYQIYLMILSAWCSAISAGLDSNSWYYFAHEVVIRHFSMKALAAISIASIISFSAKNKSS